MQSGRRTSRSLYPPADSATYRIIHERMARLGNVPQANGEPTKLTRYEGGEWYNAHDDAKSHEQYQAFPYLRDSLDSFFQRAECNEKLAIKQ